MNSLINDLLRVAISFSIRVLGAILSTTFGVRLKSFSLNQARLKRKYQIEDETPILAYGKDLEVLIDAAARKRRGVRFAMTSGSTGTPKRLLFTSWRILQLKLIFTDFFVRLCWHLSIRRTGLYVFSSSIEDKSLTSLLLQERRTPSYLSILQAPYRLHSHPAVQALASKYGVAAVRLWLLTLANPGVIYSTNPSTISTFFDEQKTNWKAASQLVRDWCEKPSAFEPSLHRIARRVSSIGAKERLESVARAATMPALEIYAPAVTTYICWNGGYVKAFLQRLEQYLPPSRYRLIPMYSMSTETVETIGYCKNGRLSFLPIAPGVLYEFLEQPGNALKTPQQLKAGHTYSLIVSDNYGLRRYDTGDLFLCRGFVNNLPDLMFCRRRELEYSFTGEKLTAEQLIAAYEHLSKTGALPGRDRFVTCIPSNPSAGGVPHYKLVLLADGIGLSPERVALSCDQFLMLLNSEYKTKRTSGRLGPMTLLTLNLSDFIKLTTNGVKAERSWEAQFKFLPLYLKTWEEMSAKTPTSEWEFAGD